MQDERKIHDIIRKIQTYVQCGYLGPTRHKQIQKLEIEWIVKGGFKRRDAPPKDISEEDKKNGTWDYAYIYSNENIYRITGCGPLTLFQEKHHLKWLAHCVRMDNSCLQKQTLFMETTSRQRAKLYPGGL